MSIEGNEVQSGRVCRNSIPVCRNNIPVCRSNVPVCRNRVRGVSPYITPPSKRDISVRGSPAGAAVRWGGLGGSWSEWNG
jgi:hypothetical protein